MRMKSVAYSISWFVAGFVATLLVSGGIQLATAADRGYRSGDGAQGFVVAQSVQGNAQVRGAVRPTSLGPQVQLPSGTWIYCRRSCSETLRVETVDFWLARDGFNGRNAGAEEQGLLGYIRPR